MDTLFYIGTVAIGIWALVALCVLAFNGCILLAAWLRLNKINNDPRGRVQTPKPTKFAPIGRGLLVGAIVLAGFMFFGA